MAQMTIEDDLFIIGTIDKIIFHNADNHFYVMVVLISETNTDLTDETIITGNFHNLDEDESYKFTGNITTHPRYGKQFNAESASKEIPRTKKGIVEYLSGEKFKGIGKKTAENVVEALGEEALSLIAQDKDNLNQVKGLTKRRKAQIYRTVIENETTERADLIMIELGIEPSKRAKIFDTYKENTLNTLEEQPYQLVEDIYGIGFKKADKIALKAGISEDSTERLRAGIKYTLETELNEFGHTYIELEHLIQGTMSLLNESNNYFSKSDTCKGIDDMAIDDKLIINDNQVTEKLFYYSEKNSANQIYKLSSITPNYFTEEEINSTIKAVENKLNIQYNNDQINAIKNVIKHSLSVVTGGPGTGKTTIVSGIIEVYRRLHNFEKFVNYDEGNEYPIQLAAPTGRAAKRMKETTGIEASTIHRMIGWGQDTEDDEIIDHIIEADLIIVDEMSMVDTWLFYQFIKNVLPETQVVFVGDDAQLPSVGPGTVFKDLIQSNVLPVTILKQIYRQSESSSIIRLAYEINNNLPVNIKERHNDRSFIEAKTNAIAEVVDIIVRRAVERGYDMRDVQVLAPIYRGPAGINTLNRILQKVLNPKSEDKLEIEFGDKVFRQHDKVIQLVNRHEDNVFNGDGGIITEVTHKNTTTGEKESLTVNFLGNYIVYERKDLTELSHAYCTSIHKAQGSEYPIVIMPMVNQYYHMLKKNIIYTGVTRAKDSLILCGDPDAFLNGIRRDSNPRNTMLKTYLIHLFDSDTEIEDTTKKRDYILTMDLVLQQSINPMINMEGVSPYDFN